MDFDKMAYPDEFEIAGQRYKGQRDRQKGEVLVPYTVPPTVNIGDTIFQYNGPNRLPLRVTDADFMQDGSLGIATKHPHMLTLAVVNVQSEALAPRTSPMVQIGSVSAHQVQIGDHNSVTVNMTVQEFVKQVASTGDTEAKGLLRKLLENNAVAAVIGAGASALLGLL